MAVKSKIRKGVFVAVLSAGAVASAGSAQAGSLGRGLLAGLLGGVALGAFAAAAQAQQQSGPIYADVPVDPGASAGTPVYVRLPPETRAAPQPQVQLRPQLSARRPARAISADVAKCGDMLSARVKELGAVDVMVASAGPEVRSAKGGTLVPITARVEYAR